MKRILSILLTLLLLFSTCSFSLAETPGTLSTDEVWDLVYKAYVYAFPLVLSNATKIYSTNTDGTIANRAPVNQLNHARQLANADYRTIVTPNVDTLYSQAWLDLSEEPIIFVLPETDRFCNMQLLDAWTNTAALLDEAGVYAIALPSWEGELPENVIRVNVPTTTVWALGRTVLNDVDDLPNVHAIQDQMQMLPLSAYLSGEAYTAPTGTYSADNEFVPLNKVFSMTPVEFFATANALMLTNAPAEADAAILEEIAAINVGPGLTFDMSILGDDIATRWTQTLQKLNVSLATDTAAFAQQIGQWLFYGAPIGDFGTEYAYRTGVAITGFGANTVDVAIYPKTLVDEAGETLTGEKTYILHFDTLPPMLEGGFWSVTVYGDDQFLIDNPIDRYCINDRSNFTLNEDGTLDIILSKDAPENTDNWLPVSDGEFRLFLRIYFPDMEALETWTPAVVRAQ